MKYRARQAEVEATGMLIEDGPQAGQRCFLLQSLTGDTLAVADSEAFLSMYEVAPEEVPVKAAEIDLSPVDTMRLCKLCQRILTDPGECPDPACRPRFAGKKPAKTAAEKPAPPATPETVKPVDQPTMSINDAVCKVIRTAGALETKEVADEVEKIRPGSNRASTFAAISYCAGKGLIRRRVADNKLEPCL